jgi:hypothetical protein
LVGLDLVVTKTTYDSEMIKLAAYEDELVKLTEIIAAYETQKGSSSSLPIPIPRLFDQKEGKQVSGVTGPDGNVQMISATAPSSAPKGSGDVSWPLYRRRDFLLMAIDEAHANIAILEAQRRKYVTTPHQMLASSLIHHAVLYPMIINRSESLVKQPLPPPLAAVAAT